MTTSRHKTWTVAVSILALSVVSQVAQAYPWQHDRPEYDQHDRHDQRPPFYTRHYLPPGGAVRGLPHDYLRLVLGGLEYYYWEGMFYRMAADQYVVVSAPVGAVVTAVPVGCQPFVVDGVPYYTVNGITYMQTSLGYQVVPPPNVVVVQSAPPPAPGSVVIQTQSAAPAAAAPAGNPDDVFTVNIPNSQGAYTAVTLKRSGNGFVGPQGEFYTEFPRVEQLKAMYGK